MVVCVAIKKIIINFFTNRRKNKEKREGVCGGRGEEMGELCEYITRFLAGVMAV
jgi:hypothetical protein